MAGLQHPSSTYPANPHGLEFNMLAHHPTIILDLDV